MSELEEDTSASTMDSLRNRLPAFYLVASVDAGSIGISLPLLAYGGAFSDDQTGGSSLSVVGAIERCRNIAGSGPHARKWRHDNAIRKRNTAQLQGLKERRVLHRKTNFPPATKSLIAAGTSLHAVHQGAAESPHPGAIDSAECDLAHIDLYQQRFRNKLVVTFVGIDPTLRREDYAVYISILRGIVEAGCATEDVHRVVMTS